MSAVVVFVGGGLGAVVRWLLQQGGVVVFGPDRPWATLLINIVGSLLMGLLAGWFASRALPDNTLKLFVLTGLLGGFTTFSAFSLDVVSLAGRGDVGVAAAYAVGSVGVSLVAVFVGLALTR
jgi:CrcB protein